MLSRGVQLVTNYIRQVNGVKLADILFSLLSVCVSVRTQFSLQQCVFLPQRISHLPHANHLADIICTLWAPSNYICNFTSLL